MVGRSNLRLQVHKPHDVEGTGGNVLFDLNPKVNGQIMYLLVNASR